VVTRTIDGSQRRAARAAGFAYLVSVAIVVLAQFGINARLIVPGNAAETARNIVAHERLFRLSIACNLAYCAGVVVLLAALYAILKPVGQNLAFLGACFRLVYALVWVVMTVNFFTVLRLLNGADYVRVFGADRTQTLARLYLTGFDAYYVGLLFYALAAAVCSYLWFRSRYIPRALSVWGVISSVWCAACTSVFVLFPSFVKVVNLWWFDSPMASFEIATSFWLLFKGLRSSEVSEPLQHAIPPPGRS